MNIKYLQDKFINEEYLSEAVNACRICLSNEDHLLVELNAQSVQDVHFEHRESVLILYSSNGYSSNTVKFILDIYVGKNDIPSGYYAYLVNLNGEFIDEFLVLK